MSSQSVGATRASPVWPSRWAAARSGWAPPPRLAPLIEALVLVAILAGAFWMRLTDLEGARSNFPDLFDEGIRAEQLFLMEQGFRPYRDIYAAQGPLLLDTLYPFYALFGGTLGAVRLGVGLLSLVGLVGAYLAARQVGGRLGGLLACALLAISPSYLRGSRLALAEVPSLAPALLALACALRYGAGGSRRWLALSALLFGVALLLKAMVFPVGLAIGLALVMREERGERREESGRKPSLLSPLSSVLWYGAVVLGLVALVVLALGPADVFDQLVVYRTSATAAAPWDPRASWREGVLDPIAGHPAFYALALLGALVLLVAAPRVGAPLVVWPLATFGLMFVYTPLHPKHLVYLAPPAAVVGGAGLGVAWRLVRKGAGRGARDEAQPARYWLLATRVAIGAAAVALLAWNVAAAQPALARGVQIAVDEDDEDLHVFDVGAARVLRALVPPDRFLLTDHPYIAYLARRMVPPELVDPSRGRKRAGTLTDEVATQAVAERDTRVVMFWADRLRRLGRFDGWVRQRFRPVASFGTRIGGSRFGKDRTVYLRNDADFTAARTALMGLLERPLRAEFAEDIRLLGVTIEPTIVAPGEPFAITLGWESVRDVKTEYNVILSLVGPDGQQYAAQELDLEGIGAGGRDWRAGEWLLRAYMLVPRAPAPPGEYRVVLGLDIPRARRAAPLSTNPDALVPPSTDAPDRVVLGTVQVR